MTDAELTALLDDLESDRVERKSSLSDKDRICEAICAFTNDLPDHRREGVVFVGVDDAGTPSALPITDELLRTLADLHDNGNIHPFPTMTVQKRLLKVAEVAVVEVWPSDFPPVRFRGRAWIRVGPRRAVATAEEERRLSEKRRARDLPFDARPLPSASVSDLDLELFQHEYLPAVVAPELVAADERSVVQQLAGLRLASTEGVPTATGVIVVRIEPTQFVPGAYVQFIRFDGGELTDPVKDQKTISGPMPLVLRLIEETLVVNISTAADFVSGPVEARVPDYPVVALQQLLRNAVLHRTYESTFAPVRVNWFADRVEIQSPGGPFGQVTESNFGTPGLTDYRNPNLAEAMKALGWVQRFGVGIPLARKELERNGNPPLEFVVNESNVLALIRSRS